jgi:hypothetical protein
MKLTGKISIKPFAPGSKSEHDAVYIDTAQGSYVLRKVDENPFENTGLYQFQGKNVTVEGTLDKYLFLANDITVLP